VALNRKLRSFLDEPRIARLATVGGDGFPHVVTIWFVRDRDDLLFACERGDQKVRNALRNPKAAVIIGGEPKRDDAGYMIQGMLTVEDDPDHAVGRRIAGRYLPPRRVEKMLTDYGSDDPVVLRLRPTKVIRVWW
jgi:PPOX class probable F420-dependent enzyme